MYSHLYLHVPFCAAKCDYCAFYSECGRDGVPEYFGKLEFELAANAPQLQNLHSLYIGGGTPTLLTIGELQRLFSMLGRYIALERIPEISIESNPETLDEVKVDFLRRRVSRLSMGVQSFSSGVRDFLGRRTSPERLAKAVKLVTEAGFRHLNFDLIYGVPGQSPAEFVADAEHACECGVDHLSCYSLTVEDGTPLASRGCESDVELEADEFEKLDAALMKYGIARYEISNYAKPGAFCIHNYEIWGGATYLGLGPAAASFDGCDRFVQVRNLRAWLNGAAPEVDRITSEARLMEIVVMKLRTVDGWTRSGYEQLPGRLQVIPWSSLVEKVQNAAILYPGCWEIAADAFRLNRNGLLIWNSIAGDLII